MMSNTFTHDPAAHYFDVDRAAEKIGDAPALNNLLDMLQVSLNRDIPQIESLLSENDVALANRMLHALKGFIPIFCSDALSQEVAAVEALSKTATASEVAVAYAALSPKLRQLQREVEQHLH